MTATPLVTTAAELVLTVAPSDDAGASTADRYDWQACMASADALRLYLDASDDDGRVPVDSDCKIVCERHEDWVAVQGGDAELVSAKHREPSYGAYTTINAMVNDGGLGHMFTRWLALQETPTCRLVTTAGLAPGPPQKLEGAAVVLRQSRLAGTQVTLDEAHAAVVTELAKWFGKSCDDLPDAWHTDGSTEPTSHQHDQTARFLSMLSLQHGQPMRDHIRYAAPNMYAKPILDRLGIDAPPDAVWEAVLALLRARMRAAGPIPTGALPEVLAYRPGTPVPGPAAIERMLAGRIVTLADVDLALRMAVANPGGYRRLPRVIRTSRVAVKMVTGGCSDNAVERAEQLRLDYQDHWRARLGADPTARAAQARLHRLLLRISDEATTAAATPAAMWGAGLWRELQDRMDAGPAAAAADLDPDLLLGGVCELANRCQVWFSDRFDVDAEIARLRAQRAGAPQP